MAPIPRILIVEDDEIISPLIATMLKRKGFAVVGRVTSGEEAMLEAVELEPDFIMMNISLSGLLDGVTTAVYLFQLFHFPIIFLTALSDDSLLEQAKAAQPYGFIMKPFTDRELTSNLQLDLYNHSIRKKSLDAGPIGEPKKIMHMLDPVLTADTKGRIIFFDPYAERFLNLPQSQILMSHWRDVMMFINDQTDEQLEDPVREVVRQMLVVSHEFNTAVVTRSGKRRKISLIVRPIKNARNELMAILIQMKEKSLDQIKMATNILAKTKAAITAFIPFADATVLLQDKRPCPCSSLFAPAIIGRTVTQKIRRTTRQQVCPADCIQRTLPCPGNLFRLRLLLKKRLGEPIDKTLASCLVFLFDICYADKIGCHLPDCL